MNISSVSRWGIILKSFLRRCEVDHAVAYALLSRVWQVAAGPITIIFIARYYSPEVQGFYYTFASLLALQSFVELGFYVVIINVASHEWSRLRVNSEGCLEGHPETLSRLISLGRLICKWYAVASIVFVICVSVAGYLFFSQADYSGVHWRAPWFWMVACTGLLLWMLPFNSMLEGCNQVAAINLFRFVQTLLASLALWLALAWHWGLWAAVAMVAARLISNAYLLGVCYRSFFKPFFTYSVSEKMSWKREIWPMQWRLALSGIMNYFAFSLFNPVMFYYHGSIVAGQMGMTWQIVGALAAVGMAWVTTKVPRFGMLIAEKKYRELDQLWLRTSLVSIAVVCLGAIGVWFLLIGLNVFKYEIAQRLLPPLPAGIFLTSCILMLVSQCQTAYIRAHKKEPIVVMSVTTSIMIGLAVWLLGSRFGPLGAAWGHLSVMSLAVIWETRIWYRCRIQWHRSLEV